MGILTKEVKVKLWSRHVKYYLNLGYEGKHGDIITVKVEDLPKWSSIKVNVQCDFCNKNKWIIYADYLRSVEKYGLYSCNKCLHYKTELTSLAKYGIINYSSTLDCKEKVKNSFSERYGVDNIAKSEEIKEKIRLTNLQKYGTPNAMQSPEVKVKANETLCKNGTQKTSKQQLYLHDLYGGELNYPISYYSADICFPEEKLVIEYDGGGHDLRVTLGKLTREEFNQKELIRNHVIKRSGYKQMRIISSRDLLPQDSTLLLMLETARTYFSNYPEHSWIEYNLDTSTLRNAENKEGVFFNFGELRKISSDVA